MDFRRLFDLLSYQQVRFPNKTAMAVRQHPGWQTFSTQACIDAVDRVSANFLDMGLKRGDRVAIMTHTGSPQWIFLDLGMQQIGVVVVPIHGTVSRTELESILEDSGCLYCLVADRELYQLVESIRGNTPNLKGIFSLEAAPDIPVWDFLGPPPNEKHMEALQGLRAAIHEDDLATILYTSGTTGKPKGVMLSHRNIVSNIKSVIPLIPVNCDKRVVSLLPPSHIFERMVTYTYLAVGASIYYPRPGDGLLKNIREIRPHYLTAVPRLLENFYDQLVTESSQRSSIYRRLLHWAIALGHRYREDGRFSLSYWIQLRLANLLIFRHWRQRFGNRIEGIIVGAAALQPALGKLFSAAGMAVREGYGLTEAAPVIAFNRFEPGGFRFGTVGIPIPGVDLRIDRKEGETSGEILVKGPNIMIGYYKKEEETRQAFTNDGWLRTGDLGAIIERRFLQLAGRKNTLFKTSSGKFVAPEPIEQRISLCPFVSQCLVTGANRPYPVALIIPAFSRLQQWCDDHDVHWTAPQFMVLNPRVVKLFTAEIEKINSDLPPHQQIYKFKLLYDPWTTTNGLLTPTLKPRRDTLAEHFRQDLEKLYAK